MSERLVCIDDLITIDDVASMLNMNVSAASNIVRGRDKKQKLRFPRPVVGKGTHAVWLLNEVVEWKESVAPQKAEARRRAQTHRKPSWSASTKSA